MLFPKTSDKTSKFCNAMKTQTDKKCLQKVKSNKRCAKKIKRNKNRLQEEEKKGIILFVPNVLLKSAQALL